MAEYSIRMKARFLILLLLSFGLGWLVIPTYVEEVMDDTFTTSSPEDVGMDPVGISEIFDYIVEGDYDIDSILVIRHGYLVVERQFSIEAKINYQLEGHSTDHQIASCTKSIISALIGIAIANGYLENTSMKMIDFFSDRTIENNSQFKQQITIEDLLTMRSGLEWWQPFSSSPDWDDPDTDNNQMANSKDFTQYVLNQPMVRTPGTGWSYSSGNSHLLSGIIEKATGKSTFEFAQEYLFESIGMEVNFWPRSPEGTNRGGGGIRLRPIDMAKFGYLYLMNGSWNGEQIIPRAYIQTSLYPHHVFSSDGNAYGYSWWVDNPEKGVACAIGAYGQYICLSQEHELVVVITANIRKGEIPHMNIIQKFIDSITH